jgi:hypothetical protein
MSPFYLRKDNIYAIPIVHYNMETAGIVRQAFQELKPDCVAVELAETMQLQLLHAASRLPDISLVITEDQYQNPLYYLCEPCDGAFEALRSALEAQVAAHCIDLDVDLYPEFREWIPDAYSITKIGLEHYYNAYRKIAANQKRSPQDHNRELYMAKKLKELSLRYDKVLFVGGMFHLEKIVTYFDNPSFPTLEHAPRSLIQLATLTEHSCRDVLAEFGWISTHYEINRNDPNADFPPDRQKLIFQLYKQAGTNYSASTGNAFPGYHLRNLMKFARNYALIGSQLMPNLFQILSVARGCVDHNYAYETWALATDYPFRKNIDNLPELDLTPDDIWGSSKLFHFQLKHKSRKEISFHHRRKDRTHIKFHPPGPFGICSYPKEDMIVENFGDFLKKKGTQILTEDATRTVPFSTSIEDGVDTRETIRHWAEKKLYVKVKGKPPGGVGSVVVIFEEDKPEEEQSFTEKYPWRVTWLGEHQQESDMAFYATPMTAKVVGPGICRCEYGGFMMSYPPRRMFDVWTDPDYSECRSKAEVLLTAAIDYASKPLIVYVAATPPRTLLKSFAKRFGKKIVYIPIGQLSPVTLNKIRAFHVLDGYDKRRIADEYIF